MLTKTDLTLNYASYVESLDLHLIHVINREQAVAIVDIRNDLQVTVDYDDPDELPGFQGGLDLAAGVLVSLRKACGSNQLEEIELSEIKDIPLYKLNF